MRWHVVRLIAGREVRDQLRDRRTLFLILGLPVVMYPLFVGVGIVFVNALKGKQLTVGVVGTDNLAAPDLTPAAGGPGGAAVGLLADPSPFGPDGQFQPEYTASALGSEPVRVVPLAARTEDECRAELDARTVDAVILIDPPANGRRVVRVLGREGEENSKLAIQRATAALNRWGDVVKQARFVRAGLPADFDRPVQVRDPQSEKPLEKKNADELRDMLVKVIPFLLVMWMLTGAVYPAIDMTAGEKERGTMETLLISPAERTEIVFGKFLATTAFSFGTALWNVALMLVAVAAAPLLAPGLFGSGLISLSGLAACIFASVPLAMTFAALALALGVFARSTKEGNYYMVPLFFAVLPLAYLSMAPGNELNAQNQWVPLTNALLFEQRLMAVRSDPFPWHHAPAVFGTLSLCVAVALWAAVYQFHRESVLFRESEGAGKGGGWSLFGKK